MRICYVLTRFPAPRETFAVTDVKALLRAGHSVSVRALRFRHPRFHELWREHGLGELDVTHASWTGFLRGLARGASDPGLLLESLRFAILPHWRRPVHVLKSLAAIPRVLELVEELQRERPDVVHLFWGHYPAMLGYLAKRELPGVVVTMFLGAYDLIEQYRGSAIAAVAVDALFTHAAVNIDAITEIGARPEDIFVIHRGIDWRKVKTDTRDKVPYRVVAAGALEERKGIGDVIEVFARVQARFPDASLVIMGEGSQRAELEKRVRKRGLHNVRFTGHAPHAHVLAEMADAEVFVFLSRSAAERLPNVVKEAMASGCFCVVSRTPGIDELITNGVHGVVVPSDDYAGAAEAVLRAFREREWVAERMRLARERVQSRFDADRSQVEYVAVWARLLRRGGVKEAHAQVAAGGSECPHIGQV
jgi:colanic acid/amylovoran biosynthesis glycosyltransferase